MVCEVFIGSGYDPITGNLASEDGLGTQPKI